MLQEDRISKVSDFILCVADVCLKFKECVESCGCQVEIASQKEGDEGEDTRASEGSDAH